MIQITLSLSTKPSLIMVINELNILAKEKENSTLFYYYDNLGSKIHRYSRA